MLAVSEKNLPSYVPCAFVPKRAIAPAVTREFYVPRRPVHVPEAKRLTDAQALDSAREGVAQALASLQAAEEALEHQLADLRRYLSASSSHTEHATADIRIGS